MRPRSQRRVYIAEFKAHRTSTEARSWCEHLHDDCRAGGPEPVELQRHLDGQVTTGAPPLLCRRPPVLRHRRLADPHGGQGDACISQTIRSTSSGLLSSCPRPRIVIASGERSLGRSRSFW